MRVEIHIEELVLHGFSPHDRARIGDAFEAALATQLAQSSLPERDASAERLDGGSIDVRKGTPAGAIGAAIAGAVSTAVGTVK